MLVWNEITLVFGIWVGLVGGSYNEIVNVLNLPRNHEYNKHSSTRHAMYTPRGDVLFCAQYIHVEKIKKLRHSSVLITL